MTFCARNGAFALAMLVAGCGEGAPAKSGGGSGGAIQEDTCAPDHDYTPFSLGMNSSNEGLTVAIESDPPVPTPGDHSTWKLTVTDQSGSPVPAGTKVTVKCLMSHYGTPSHGCPAPIRVEELDNGVYEAKPVIFNMQGHWHIDFGVGTSDVPIELCVE